MVMTETPTIERALVALAARDTDHAQHRNGIGFNGRDTAFGNSLAFQVAKGKVLSERQLAGAYRMLRTYRAQLAAYGIDYDQIATPEARTAAVPTVTGTARMDGDVIVVEFDGYPGALLPLVKATPGRRYVSADKSWIIPFTPAVIDHIESWPPLLAVGPDVTERIRAHRERAAEVTEGSRAVNADLDLPIASEMMPFQRAGVAYAAEHRRVLIADEMGLGKTLQALATLEHEGAYPALVIVPAVVKLNWVKEATRWFPGRSTEILAGRTPYPLAGADIAIINYDVLDAWGPALGKVGFRAIVADESHYLKNPKAKRTKAVVALAKIIDVRLLLTGTPILNRPIELVSQLTVLDRLAEFGGYWPFVTRYCGAYKASFGWDMSGATNLGELHDRLRASCMVRRTKEQVLTELPPKRRASVPMELTDRARYDEVRRELKRWLAERLEADASWQEQIRGMPDAKALTEQAAFEKQRRMGRAAALVKIEALKQVAAEEKLTQAGAWIADFLASGRKLVVFGVHRHIIASLAERFAEEGVVTLTGETSPSERQGVVDRFQDDPGIRLFIGNVQAAGVGITLTAASDVAFVELPWRPGDLTQAEDRCHRIGQDDSVTAWYLLAAGTIEENIARMLDTKRAVVDHATDGTQGLDPKDSLLDALLTALDEEDE